VLKGAKYEKNTIQYLSTLTSEPYKNIFVEGEGMVRGTKILDFIRFII
jgi:hypothetical protein